MCVANLQEQYERSGPKNFFMPPAFVPGAKLGGLQEMELGKDVVAEAPVAKAVSDREKDWGSKRKYTERCELTCLLA